MPTSESALMNVCPTSNHGSLQNDYLVYGLHVQSNVPFSLRPLSGTSGHFPRVEFLLKQSGDSIDELCEGCSTLGTIRNGARRPAITVDRVTEGYLLKCKNGPKLANFLVSEDLSRIECYPDEGLSRQDIECWLFGLVMAFVLQKRGIFSLHGAAVECFGKGIAFLGNNGYGKSTLAFFFMKQGHRLLTDDVLALAERSVGFMALPACPSMNLWPNTLSELGGENVDMSPQEIQVLKARFSLRHAESIFCESEIPLERVYLLSPVQSESDRVRITPVPKPLALMELFRHTRAGSILTVEDQKKLLQTYGRLTSRVSVCKLEYPAGFERLPGTYEAILQDEFQAQEEDKNE